VTKYSLDQQGWINKLRSIAPFPFDLWQGNPRQAMWFNPTNDRSMRLTKAGYTHLTLNIQLTRYEFKLPEKIKPKVLLQLERYIAFPYYIQSLSRISVFDEETAIMLQLHGSDLETYLNNLEKHQ
jgi:hypothetical protein